MIKGFISRGKTLQIRKPQEYDGETYQVFFIVHVREKVSQH